MINQIDWQNIFYLTASLAMLGIFGLIIFIYFFLYRIYQIINLLKENLEKTGRLITQLEKNFKLTVINLLLKILKKR